MTVYTHNPFEGMRNPAPYGGGIAGGLMNRPPPFMPQQPMPRMPRRMPGGPSKGGTTSIPMRRPPMKRPGGPGKARTGGGLMRRGRGRGKGRPMPGGPGKGRGQMQQPMPQINFGQGSMPMPTPRTQGPSSISSSPLMIQQGLGETGQFGQLMDNRPVSPPDFGQRRSQGPMNMPPPFMPQPSGGFFLGNMLNNAMSQGQIGQPQQSFMGRVGNNMPQPPMEFPQPTARPDQTMGRPMPQPSGFDSRVGDGMTPGMGRIPQGFTQGPSRLGAIMRQPRMTTFMPTRNMGYGGGFYGGGITDLY